MEGPSPLTRQEHAVLGHMLQRPGSDYYALEISKAIRVSARSLYPILNLFERLGWIEGEWEDENKDAGGSRRRYYRLTLAGKAVGRSIEAADYRDVAAIGALGTTS